MFLARALEKDSAKRFQSADAFADALEKALDEESATSETVALKPLMSTENGLREKDDTAQVESAGENMPAEEPHTALWRASKKPQDEMAAVAPSSFEPTVETPAEMAPASDVPVSDEPRPTTDISSQIAPPEPEQPTPLSLMDVDAARGNDEAVPSPTGDLDGSAADAGAAEEAETGALDKRPYGPETLSMLRQASSPRGYWIAGGAGTLLLVVVLLVWSPWAGSGTRPSGPADVSSTRESAAADASGTLDVGLSGTAVATNESERSAARHEGRQDDPLRGAGNSLSRGSDLTTEPAAPVTVSLEDVRSSAGEVVSQVALASDVQDSPSGDAVPNAALDVSAGSAASAIDERTGTESAAASKEEPVSAPSSNSGQSKPDGGRQSAPAERRPEQKEPVKVSEPRKTSEKKAESRQVRKSSGHEAERNRDMPRGDSDHESKATAKVDVESQTARLVKKAQGYIIAGSFEKALDALSEAKSLGGRRNQIRKMTKKCYEGIKTRQAKELVGQAVSAFRRRDFDSCISLAAKARKLDSSNGDAETLLNECKEKKDLEGMKF